MFYLFVIYTINHNPTISRYKSDCIDEILCILIKLQKIRGNDLTYSIFRVNENGVSKITSDDLSEMGYRI